MTDIAIDAAFDSGNIEVLTIADTAATLKIRQDRDSDFFQWFHFRVSQCAGRALTLRIARCAVAAAMVRTSILPLSNAASITMSVI